MKLKSQYSYFIHPYIVEKRDYVRHLLKLLKNSDCTLKLWSKKEDSSIYKHFLPVIRKFMFKSFSYTPEQLDEFKKLSPEMKALHLAKESCTIFEYSIGSDVQGKIGERKGIFFDLTKMQIICFNTGVCFILLKTVLDGETTLEDLINYNYKFRDINSDFVSLQNNENIKIQTNSLKDINDISKIIKTITGNNSDATLLNLNDERFLTYSYACVDKADWNEKTNTEKIEEDFEKFANVLPYSYEIASESKANRFKTSKYVLFGSTKQGTALLTSTKNEKNQEILSNSFENEYLYSYILTLYKKLFLKKVCKDIKEDFEHTREDYVEFTQLVLLQETTDDNIGTELINKWEKSLEISKEFENTKEKMKIISKDKAIKKGVRSTLILTIILAVALAFSLVNFAIFMANLGK